MSEYWPFKVPRATEVVADASVFGGVASIRYVEHGILGQGWKFLAHLTPPAVEADRRVVELGSLVEVDPSILAVAELPPGWWARRAAAGEPWFLGEVVARHLSPDGSLILEWSRATDGDETIGFAPGIWHTHPELLTVSRGETRHQAASTFIEAITSSTLPLAVYCRGGRIEDVVPVWDQSLEDVLDDPYFEPGESVMLRLWDGTLLEAPRRGT